ncbi:3'(2'),5'-bisphosphate nucleotidase CysQ [Frankia sp. AgB1.9]|uniref:3'(2'),5'-bisphosphate nucleotidase CysQ n=1 Tax=unclassified Frankia TaxID=2632575 RepID=UPI0019346180|nr:MULTISPECIES: 3'(2'),5'-bisphosphate nucleotidase CysQ [unclassified Frankia]MBL7490772.1 3'(2'),5'-bisphosphate nucleotidase CysQ [Frankia sp. AgW1.1]MBL7550349.1 3'(2'),5'-bisphosphate nucleotidase CysQ [Frankia sp. AgB1.9]MBL7621022.1 3'(2'),5'-bisphosphate nucleotidase CysQ [Frankia sp. AgB1.8]
MSIDTTTAELADAELASLLAEDAGRRLLEIRAEVGFADGPALKDAGDAGSQRLLAAALARHRPKDAVLSEEAVDDPVRLRADRVWIVDPLDGTREFAEEGRTDWAVHVALWQAGGLVAGAVALPAVGVTLSSATITPPPAGPAGPVRLVASRTRAPKLVTDVTERIGGVVIPMGSAGAKASAVIRGEADVYLHAGGQYEWDSAAPVAVALAAGLHATRIDGSPLRYNQADPLLPDLVICRPELAEAVLAAIRASSSG